MGVLGFTHFFQEIEEGGGCPTITLGDFVGEQPYIDGSVDANGAYITEGEGPYTITLESGSLPGGVTGLMSVETEPGVWVWLFEGTFYTDLVIYTFTIGGTDANGCVITPREYTVEVRARFEGTVIPYAGSSSSQILWNNITGLPTSLGTGVEIHSIEFNAHVDGPYTLADVGCDFADLNDTAFLILFSSLSNILSGQDLTNTVLSPDGVGLISSGTPPYSATFSDSQVSGSFADFNGLNPNDGFYSNLSNEPGDVTGGFISATIIFKPI
jgi:hypothetical protein